MPSISGQTNNVSQHAVPSAAAVKGQILEKEIVFGKLDGLGPILQGHLLGQRPNRMGKR